MRRRAHAAVLTTAAGLLATAALATAGLAQPPDAEAAASRSPRAERPATVAAPRAARAGTWVRARGTVRVSRVGSVRRLVLVGTAGRGRTLALPKRARQGLMGRRGVTVAGPLARPGGRWGEGRVLVVRRWTAPARAAGTPRSRGLLGPAIVPPRSGAPAPGSSLPGTLAWAGDFETNGLSQWSGVQRVADDRVQVVGSPVAQGARAARIEVRQGDNWQNSGGNRAELVRMTGENEGDERWYDWSTMFAPGYPSTTTGWQIFTQWHASAGGTQPTVVFYVSGEKIGFKTVESDATGKSKPSVVHWTGPIDRGAWHHFRLHVKWSSDPATGWVELWHDGVQVVQRTAVATLIPGQDVYLKQGLYRSNLIAPTAVLYHDGMRMSRVG